MNKREITKLEKQIVNDIMARSNYGVEKTTEIAKVMVDFGYTIHEQDYYKLKKVIEILKDILIVEDFTKKDGSHKYYMCRRNVFPVFTMNLTKEQYEQLKEVLGND